jgi:hypothetical protein
MGYAARAKRRKMDSEIKLPEATRQRLYQARIAAVQAQAVIEKYDAVILTALEMAGIDPATNPQVNFETGVITPAPTPIKPEVVKEEAAS